MEDIEGRSGTEVDAQGPSFPCMRADGVGHARSQIEQKEGVEEIERKAIMMKCDLCVNVLLIRSRRYHYSFT